MEINVLLPRFNNHYRTTLDIISFRQHSSKNNKRRELEIKRFLEFCCGVVQKEIFFTFKNKTS